MSSTKKETLLIHFLQSFEDEELREAFNLLYDSFIRDQVNGELPHEKRVLVHDVWRGLEGLVEEKD